MALELSSVSISRSGSEDTSTDNELTSASKSFEAVQHGAIWSLWPSQRPADPSQTMSKMLKPYSKIYLKHSNN